MLANWSLILNGLLLIIVVISIGRLMKARRVHFKVDSRLLSKPLVSMKDEGLFFDDIIAVRRVGAEAPLGSMDEEEVFPETALPPIAAKKPVTTDTFTEQVLAARTTEPTDERRLGMGSASQTNATNATIPTNQTIVLFLQAKENRMLAGYELLQTVLAAGLRFGEGGLFHRHQYSNGQGPVLCSLASATAKGTFDLQNIGAFSVRGLCLFMQSSGNATIDAERFHIMLETANQLRDDLDAHLLDFQQRPFTEESVAKYYQLLEISRCQDALAQT